jgi:hypothetical protein
MNPIVIRNLNHYFGEQALIKQTLFDINLEIKALVLRELYEFYVVLSLNVSELCLLLYLTFSLG